MINILDREVEAHKGADGRRAEAGAGEGRAVWKEAQTHAISAKRSTNQTIYGRRVS